MWELDTECLYPWGRLKSLRPAASSCCMLCVHAWRICDAETSDGSAVWMCCQAWIVRHSTWAFHKLAAGHLVSGLYSVCNVMLLVGPACSRVQMSSPWLTGVSYVAKLRRTSGCSLSSYTPSMLVPDELFVLALVPIWVCLCVYVHMVFEKLECVLLFGQYKYPFLWIISESHGCPGIMIHPSLSAIFSLVCFFAACYLETMGDRRQLCLLGYCWREPPSVQT